MTSAELADYFADFVTAGRARVNGVGAEQYANPEGQKFETMPPLELIQWAREEAQDLAVYAAMLDIQLSKLAVKLGGVA